MNCDQRALHLSNFLAWWWEWERIVENPCGYFEPQCARVMSTQMGVTVHTEKEVIRSHCTWSFKLRYKVLCDLIVASWVCVCVCVCRYFLSICDHFTWTWISIWMWVLSSSNDKDTSVIWRCCLNTAINSFWLKGETITKQNPKQKIYEKMSMNCLICFGTIEVRYINK